MKNVGLKLWYVIKSVRIQGFSGLSFATFELNTKNHSEKHHIQSDKLPENHVGKYRQEKTANTDIFYAIFFCLFAFNKSMSKNLNVNKNIKERNKCKAKLKYKFNQAFIYLLFAHNCHLLFFCGKLRFIWTCCDW